MVFFKKVEIRDLSTKLGGTQRGIYALERIEKGEKIWFCKCGDKDGSFTRDQLLDIIAKHPRLDYFVRSFSYMIDEDLYAMPHSYMEEKNNDECALFNHSCNPNCGFAEDGFGDNVVACRDIDIGEELNCHYGFLETEASLIYGLKCKCNSINCCGILTFDYYRDPVFVEKYFNYMTPYLKEKSIDIKKRWHSRACYVKRYPVKCLGSPASNALSDSSDDSYDIEESQKSLFSLFPIKKGELVASFNDSGEISEEKHYLKNSQTPNCYVIGRNIYADMDIPAETELTLYYHGILL